ncbi:hypothetical protein RIF29_15672 [Crotalaria pallida]|uniref:Uncharacterized protein n=1 Tax=Crotalaria pallida TaxID=3830 RepID=A0AAN9FHK7_CROPI
MVVKEKETKRPSHVMRLEAKGGNSGLPAKLMKSGIIDNKQPRGNPWEWRPKFFQNERYPKSTSKADLVFNVVEDDLMFFNSSFVGTINLDMDLYLFPQHLCEEGILSLEGYFDKWFSDISAWSHDITPSAPFGWLACYEALAQA